MNVTTSGLRERAQGISLCVKGRIASEQIRIQVSKEKLRSQPNSMIQNNIERLQSKKQDLWLRAKFALSSSIKNIKVLRIRFERERFLRRLQVEQDRNSKVSLQLKNRFRSLNDVKFMKYRHIKDRLKIEKILHRICIEKKSLDEKMATMKASDPKSALQRGFALVYRQDGKLIKSITDVNEKDKINTNVADGYITSEVTLKGGKHE